MNYKKNLTYFILVFLMMFFINNKVFAVSEKYEYITSKGWGTTTDVNIKNTINGKKSTEYIVSFPAGTSYSIDSNSNQFCVFPVYRITGKYIYFPLNNSCKTEIKYRGWESGLTATQSYFSFNVNVQSSLPTLKKCSDEQKKGLGFNDSSNSECYYCSSHQCLGDINVDTSTKEVGIIYKEAKKTLKMLFGGEQLAYQKNDAYKDVNKGMVSQIKGIKDKKAILIKLNGQSGKLQYLTRYNSDDIAGAGVIEVKSEHSDDEDGNNNQPTTLTKGCPDYALEKIKAIDNVSDKIECYYCKSKNCKGNIEVSKDTGTVAIVYDFAFNTLKISLDKSEYFKQKNEWERIDYYSISSIYGAKSEQAILLNLTGKDGTIDYAVKYNDNSDAGSGKIIIGSGINPDGGQTGDNSGEIKPGDVVTGCEVIPEVIRKWINNILKFVRYVALALVIALGALDFMKAAGDGEADAMKKAGQSFMKRMIAVVILFLLPEIVDFILNMVNIYGVDTNNIDCLKPIE